MTKITSLLRSCAAAVALSITMTPVANAVTTKFNFSGYVSSVDQVLASSVPINTVFSGWFVLDSSVPNSSTFSNHAVYQGALVDGSVSYGALTVGVLGGAAQVQPPPSYNMFNTVAGSAFGLGGVTTASGLSGWTATGWNFQLASSAGTAFSLMSFPNSNLITNLSLYDSATFTTILNDGTYNHMLSGKLSSVALAPVPEPETYAMLLAGLGLLGFTARRRKNVVA